MIDDLRLVNFIYRDWIGKGTMKGKKNLESDIATIIFYTIMAILVSMWLSIFP